LQFHHDLVCCLLEKQSKQDPRNEDDRGKEDAPSNIDSIVVLFHVEETL
jgi:hypothetical protein